MIKTGCLVVYKNRPAFVTETGEKITITAAGAGNGTETFRVREKDVEVLHPGPVTSLAGFVSDGGRPDGDIRDAWELLEGSGPVSLRELAELASGGFSPQSAWAAWLALYEALYFTGTVNAISPRPAAEVAAAEEKRRGRERETKERESFLKRLRDKKLNLPEDGRFLQDVEALAYGKSEKSRTLKDSGRPETPQEAHRFLVESGFWDTGINPHPIRLGISLSKAPAFEIPPALLEGRRDLRGMTAFAIDSPWSADPDDAVSLERSGPGFDGARLFVHVSDPAAAVGPGSPADIEARNRGATAYLPEKCCRMLSDEALPHFALGLAEKSPALTFALTLDSEAKPAAVEIFPSLVHVTRLTYEQADSLAESEDGHILRELFQLGEANLARRLSSGAVNIELPEIHLSVERPETARAAAAALRVTVERIMPCKSAEMVRECMLLAGEGAADWARKRHLAFPYIVQETGDLPSKPLPGLAGSCQLRRCMRPRSVSARPGLHWGLGIDGYTQVTSPLRRYTDLLAHQQIRAFLAREAGNAGAAEPLSQDEVLLRLSAGDTAAQAVTQAERASKAHWLAVYLSDKKGSEWEGVVVEKRGNFLGLLIPALAMETQIPAKKNLELNDAVKLTLSQVRIPEAEAVFKER
ncbi:MAG: RNB domain-containing ribonuclease [Treponema sp.]|jgi:exoribonuclease-2|nr:RNB domain-containing ribonuclease [Treponema sp.]